MQLVPGTDTHRPTAWYVGQQSWSLPWLAGRIVSTEVAAAALRAAETLQAGFAVDHPRWDEVHEAARLLGLTARDLAGALRMDERLVDGGSPSVQPETAGMPRGQHDSPVRCTSTDHEPLPVPQTRRRALTPFRTRRFRWRREQTLKLLRRGGDEQPGELPQGGRLPFTAGEDGGPPFTPQQHETRSAG